MTVESGCSICGTNTLPHPRKNFSKHEKRQLQMQNEDCTPYYDLYRKKRFKQYSCSPIQKLNYWLAASIFLNAICLSMLMGFIRPSGYQDKQGALEDGGRSYVNGAGDSHLRYTNCSGQGRFEYDEINGGWCQCYSCFTGSICSEIIHDCVINFDHGDPKMFEKYWSLHQNTVSAVLRGNERMSYFSDKEAVCWFLEPSLAMEIKLMHKMIGNAVTEGHHIVVGTGSSQLISAALYALSSLAHHRPVDVVSASPFYSSYPPMTNFLESQLHHWAGDASSYKTSGQNAYIELVTSPGNPDGMIHSAVVDGTGPVIYDLAYYWPHYTPITEAADYDIMLFTVSKTTGHAGTRIGWALVRDIEVAKKMTKYIELSTIGVSKDSQFRTAQILKGIRISYSDKAENSREYDSNSQRRLFHFGYEQMDLRWRQLRHAIGNSQCFSVVDFPSGYCQFFEKNTRAHPAFAWLYCEMDEDCHAVFKANGILTRSGLHFGSSRKYIRISMLDHDNVFQLFIDRVHQMASSCHKK
ncbi:hypothetical protein KP509_10G039800 [Ceratopteris richardii]|uniref:Alliinase C-terminal domain-containing protein n=1 Tax=Ceratopteris richardii TaxID=49495 RepID=A0A8T2U0I4_CERRI|nr:hypothetical protein KP509_10G039800 [Ceratopteris richardii]